MRGSTARLATGWYSTTKKCFNVQFSYSMFQSQLHTISGGQYSRNFAPEGRLALPSQLDGQIQLFNKVVKQHLDPQSQAQTDQRAATYQQHA